MKLLFQLHKTFFNNFSVFDSLLTGVILPLFKGEGAKANNKDNYRAITLFPTLCKIYEMVLLDRIYIYIYIYIEKAVPNPIYNI